VPDGTGGLGGPLRNYSRPSHPAKSPRSPGGRLRARCDGSIHGDVGGPDPLTPLGRSTDQPPTHPSAPEGVSPSEPLGPLRPFPQKPTEPSNCWPSMDRCRPRGSRGLEGNRLLIGAGPRLRTCLTLKLSIDKLRGRSRSRAPEPRNEISPFHSITWSARSRIEGGTVRPSALAVLRLTTISNLVGNCTGSSAGFAPRRMRST
jgi:hypothetical protein